uniref:Uncharacterized protein n=1 Tax=Arundo donax TaxID=35708 RepID=A0A0A9GD83_ARUDO
MPPLSLHQSNGEGERGRDTLAGEEATTQGITPTNSWELLARSTRSSWHQTRQIAHHTKAMSGNLRRGSKLQLASLS